MRRVRRADRPRGPTRLRRVAACAILVLGALAVAGAEGSDGERTARRVKTTTPRRENLRRVLRYPGTVLAYQRADLAAMVQGQLAEVAVFEGDVVGREKVLARIAAPDLEAERNRAGAAVRTAAARIAQAEATGQIARATLREKEATVRVWKADVDVKEKIAARRLALVERQAATTEEAQEAEAQAVVAKARGEAALASADLARAGVQDADAALEIARARNEAARAELLRLETLLGFTQIRSPYSEAVVTRRFVDAGALVQVDGSPILTVMDVSRVRILVHVPERDVRQVARNQPVEIRLDADPDTPIDARLTRLAGALDPRTHTMRCEIELANPDGVFVPGMYCDVRITVSDRANALMLPASAVIRKGAKRYVFVNRDGVARRVEIETGFDDGIRIEVVSGIGEDDQVIDGKPDLEDGDPVVAQPGGKA